MNKLIAWLRNIQISRIVTTFAAGILLFISTACNSGSTMANPVNPVKTADQIREEVPSRAVTSEYKGGMNDYSEVDPRFDDSEAKAKAKALVDKTERNVIDQTDDLGTNTKRILDKKGENAADFGKNLKGSTEETKNKTQESVRDFVKGTQRGTENLKDNTADVAKDAAKGTKQATEDAKGSTKSFASDAKENIKNAGSDQIDKADNARESAGGYLQKKVNEAANSAKQALNNAVDDVD